MFIHPVTTRSITYEQAEAAGMVNRQRATLDSALALTAVWCCVRVLAEGVSSLPCIVYSQNGDIKKRAPNHPLYPIVHDSPNSEMTAKTVWETLVLHYSVFGNAYAEVFRPDKLHVKEIIPLDSRLMTMKRNTDGRLKYEYGSGADAVEYDEHEILHFKSLSLEGLVGLNVLTVARNALTLSDRAEEFGRAFFGNAARPGGLLKTARTYSDEERGNIAASWRSLHSGASNVGKTILLEDGLDFMPLQISNEESEYSALRQFQILECCRIFNVPPHRIKALDRATWGNIEAENISFVQDTLRPILVGFEQEIDRKCFLPSEKGSFFVEFLVDSLLRGDTTTRYNAYASALQNKWMTVNEVRALENLEAKDGGDDLGLSQPAPEVPPPVTQPVDPTQETTQETDPSVNT